MLEGPLRMDGDQLVLFRPLLQWKAFHFFVGRRNGGSPTKFSWLKIHFGSSCVAGAHGDLFLHFAPR